MAGQVNYALLYRTPRQWRITVRPPQELACGALEKTSSLESFQVAAGEFEDLLATYWGLDGPFVWDEFKPDWWGIEWVPGALDSERQSGAS